MAFTVGSAGAAGYGTVNTVSTEICNASGTSVWVKCRSNSADSLLINIPLLHGTAWLILDQTDPFVGRFGYLETIVVNAKALSSTANLSWGICSKMGS